MLTTPPQIAGEAHLIINDDVVHTNISTLNSQAGSHKVVPVELTLKKGDVNTITLGAMGSEGKNLLSSPVG